MSKITLYFPNQDAYDAYWGNDKPGSKYLCIIESVDVDESGEQTLSNVLITTSNNSPSNPGTPVEMGQSTVDVVTEQDEILDAATAKASEIKEGPKD